MDELQYLEFTNVTGFPSPIFWLYELLALVLKLHLWFLLTLPLVRSVDAITLNEILMVMSIDLCQENAQWYQKAECLCPLHWGYIKKSWPNRSWGRRPALPVSDQVHWRTCGTSPSVSCWNTSASPCTSRVQSWADQLTSLKCPEIERLYKFWRDFFHTLRLTNFTGHSRSNQYVFILCWSK